MILNFKFKYLIQGSFVHIYLIFHHFLLKHYVWVIILKLSHWGRLIFQNLISLLILLRRRMISIHTFLLYWLLLLYSIPNLFLTSKDIFIFIIDRQLKPTESIVIILFTKEIFFSIIDITFLKLLFILGSFGYLIVVQGLLL